MVEETAEAGAARHTAAAGTEQQRWHEGDSSWCSRGTGRGSVEGGGNWVMCASTGGLQQVPVYELCRVISVPRVCCINMLCYVVGGGVQPLVFSTGRRAAKGHMWHAVGCQRVYCTPGLLLCLSSCYCKAGGSGLGSCVPALHWLLLVTCHCTYERLRPHHFGARKRSPRQQKYHA